MIEVGPLERGILEHSLSRPTARRGWCAGGALALQGAARTVYNIENGPGTSSVLKPKTFDLILTRTRRSARHRRRSPRRRSRWPAMAQFRSDVDLTALKKKGGVLRPSPRGLAMGAAPDGKAWKEKDRGRPRSCSSIGACSSSARRPPRDGRARPGLLCNKDTRFVREYLMGKKDARNRRVPRRQGDQPRRS
ncbi:MAG: hypothetical protein U1F43_37200 [Myxococcota bacterium]